ncbi:MAG: FAD:protein FMN transferase [Kiritimatiellae bacterium]|nr:FAD:protein FMN transferase [Kiritimatiellia bacterium]
MDSAGDRERTFTHRAMDTEFRVSFGEGEDMALCASAAAVAFERIDELERLLSRFNDTSDVAVIRALRPGQVATVASETMAILVECVRVCAATNGAFDPTVGTVTANMPRERNGRVALPRDRALLDDQLSRSGMQRLVLDVEHLRVAVKEDRLGRATPLELDFGGVGKGFALDECRKMLTGEQFELSCFLLDAGTSTQWAQGAGWKLGVGGMWKDRTKIATVLEVKDAALSGSGFELQGEHVVDVRRHGAARRWEQAWAWCGRSAAVADALSTAALALSRRELAAAARALDARILVARRQPPIIDRLRDPLVWVQA